MLKSQLAESIIAMIFGAVIILADYLTGMNLYVMVLGGLLFVVGLIYIMLELLEKKSTK